MPPFATCVAVREAICTARHRDPDSSERQGRVTLDVIFEPHIVVREPVGV
jgi:hypothetical protein